MQEIGGHQLDTHVNEAAVELQPVTYRVSVDSFACLIVDRVKMNEMRCTIISIFRK